MGAVPTIRTYSELIQIPTFDERFEYLKIGGGVGADTFGFDRYLNQRFYTSKEWREIRDYIIVRDLGHDMAMPDNEYEIFGMIVVHHMNPMCIVDLTSHKADILDPEFLVCVSDTTHRAIHYGDKDTLSSFFPIERKPGDTCLWR